MMKKNEYQELEAVKRSLWIAAFIVNSITLVFIYLKFKPGNMPMALHYNVLIGVDEFGPGWRLYQLPLVGFMIIIVNAVVAQKLMVDSYLQRVLAGMAVVCNLGLLGAALFLTRVN